MHQTVVVRFASDLFSEKGKYTQHLRRCSRQREQRAGEIELKKAQGEGCVRTGGTIGKDDSTLTS